VCAYVCVCMYVCVCVCVCVYVCVYLETGGKGGRGLWGGESGRQEGPVGQAR
jgi:hypothetical protein